MCDRFVDERRHFDALATRCCAARLQSGEVEDLRDEIAEAARLFHNHGAVILDMRRIAHDAVREILSRRCQRGERRVHFMRDACDELELLHALSLGAAREDGEQNETAGEQCQHH